MMKAIFKKEMKSYFTSPLGYVILFVMFIFGGMFYFTAFSNGSADMTYVFNYMITIIFFVIPVITMRSFSEEKRQKTDQLLLTSPISNGSMVMGKFLSSLTFFNAFVVLMIIYNFLFYFFDGNPDLMILLGNIIGIELFAGSLIAIGIFISSLTESQVVAAVGSFAVSFFLLMLTTISNMANNEIVTKICNWISFSDRYYTFTDGVFNIANFVFFLSIIAVFLFLTSRVIDRKRWA